MDLYNGKQSTGNVNYKDNMNVIFKIIENTLK